MKNLTQKFSSIPLAIIFHLRNDNKHLNLKTWPYCLPVINVSRGYQLQLI